MKRNVFLRTVLSFIPGALMALSPIPASAYPQMRKVTNINPKTRRVWTVDDIVAGLYVIRCDAWDIKTVPPQTFNGTIIKQIGYNLAMGSWRDSLKKHGVTQEIRPVNNYYTINSISDGWCHGIFHSHKVTGFTKQQLAMHLNRDPKGWRPATREEVIDAIVNCKKNFL